MKTNFFSASTDLDDLVFENRNKMYGAYDLRKTYEERLTLSTMAAVSFFMLLFAALYYLQPVPQIPDIIIPEDPMVTVITPVDPPIIELPKRMFPEPAANAVVIPKVTKEKVIDDKLPPKNNEATNNSAGNGNATTGNGTDPDVTGTVTTQPYTPPVETPVVKDFAMFYDKAPEFQGGQRAYENYLQTHINYPDYAISNNIQGTIFLMVKIDEKGKIVGVEVVKGIGGGCDQEAARVIKSMPDWKPALQNGRAVAVKCVLRVKMLLQN